MKKFLLSMLLLASVLLAACGGAASTPAGSATKIPVVADSGVVSAEGRLQPKQYASLSFAVGGQIAEILVTEGAPVQKDQVLARLKSREAALAEVARAELEKVNAEIALKNLKENAEVATAQAQLDLARAKDVLDKAERDLRNFKNPDLDYYQRQVAKAEDALKAAQENVTLLDLGTAGTNLKLAQDALKNLDDNLHPNTLAAIRACLNSPCPDQKVDWLRGAGAPKLQDARDWYNDALNRITTAQIQLEQAKRNNSVGQRDLQKALDDARQNLNDAQNPDPLKVAVYEGEVLKAKAAVADAERRYSKVKSSVDPDQLAAADARLNTAKSTLDSAKVNLANTELKAPFTGTLAEIKPQIGEQVGANQPIITMADFSKWVVKTNNLTEIEVVKVSAGQKATVKLDAMPDIKLNGVVDSVSSSFVEQRGDITYAITINVSDLDPKMRWGMTAQVTFEK